jgi:hypothetical protein
VVDEARIVVRLMRVEMHGVVRALKAEKLSHQMGRLKVVIDGEFNSFT